MLTLCSTYIAKENLSAFLSSSLSFLPPTAALCQSYPQPGRPVALWLAFLPAPLASRVAKILFSSVPSMKILFLFFNASCQISVPSFHQAKLSALQKNGCLFFTLYINYCFNQKRLDSTITPCAQRPHDARGRAGYDTRWHNPRCILIITTCNFSLRCCFGAFWHNRLVFSTPGLGICIASSASWRVPVRWVSFRGACEVASSASVERQAALSPRLPWAYEKSIYLQLIAITTMEPEHPLLWQLVWCQSASKPTSVSLVVARTVRTCQNI